MARDASRARPPLRPGARVGRAARRRSRPTSLGRLLLSITVVSSAVCATFWTAWTWDRLGHERGRAQAAVAGSADRAAAALAGFMAERTDAALGASRAIDPAALTRSPCAGDLPSAFPVSPGERPIDRYDLVEPDGSVRCTTAPGGAGGGPAHHHRGAPWLAEGYVAGTPTGHYRDPTTGRPVWAVAFPVASGPRSGWLAAVVEIDPASEQLGEIFADDSNTEFLLWDARSGDVLSRPEGSSWTAGDPDGRIVASRPVPATTWRLAAGVPRSTAYAGTWREVRGGVLALAATVVALALTTALVHRRIVRPLGAITAAARRTAQGGTTSLDEAGPAELAELAGALNHLTASRASSEELLKVTAEDLAHSLERLDAVLANSADMVLIVNAEGRIGFASPAATRVCGPAARLGADLTSLVHPDDAGAAAALLRPRTSGDAPVALRLGNDADGWRVVEVVARDLLDHPAVRGVVLNGRDVTERVAEAAERSLLDEQLHQSQRLESLGALAGGIAHDFKNLLSVIVWTTDMVANEPAGGELADDLDEIREAAARGVELAQQLLTFARRDQALPEPIDVGAELLGLAELLRRTLGDHIDLDLRVDAPLPAVRVNRSRFDQAVVNLAVNARDAMAGGGRLVVGAGEHAGGAEPGLAPGRFVEVAVSDTGSGMAPDVARRAVEPFYTTKEAGHGTGLGLAIVHGIVTSAGGAVRIQSAVGSGTTVRLLLPASSEPSPTAGAGADVAPALGSGQVVLVVEDDDALRGLVQRMLRAGNYVAVGAAGPTAALAVAARRDQRLDVVLTDLLMPGMSGADLAARLADARPGLPVVYMSAYTADILEELVDGGSPVVLEKPFTQCELLGALQAALATTRTASGR